MARLIVLLFSLVLIANVIANGRNQGQPPTFVCTEDGYFTDFYRSCVVYYLCEAGVKHTFGCKTGERFDEAKAMCVPEGKVMCPYPKSN